MCWVLLAGSAGWIDNRSSQSAEDRSSGRKPLAVQTDAMAKSAMLKQIESSEQIKHLRQTLANFHQYHHIMRFDIPFQRVRIIGTGQDQDALLAFAQRPRERRRGGREAGNTRKCAITQRRLNIAQRGE